jgi:hypothetical protein
MVSLGWRAAHGAGAYRTISRPGQDSPLRFVGLCVGHDTEAGRLVAARVTRYDKLARNFLAAATLIGALYWIKL